MSPSPVINTRVSPELYAAIREQADREGVSVSELHRRALETHLQVNRTPLMGHRRLGETVDLAVWLAGRSGMPRALIGQRIRAGRVKVAGEVCLEERVAVPEAGSVELDGERF